MKNKPSNEELAQAYARRIMGNWCDDPWFKGAYEKPYLNTMWDRIWDAHAKGYLACLNDLEKQDE